MSAEYAGTGIWKRLMRGRVGPETAGTAWNAVWIFVDRILRLAMGFVVGILLARYLAPDAFGEYNLALAFVALFGSITYLGLNTIVVRELVGAPEAADATLGTAFALMAFGALVALVLAVATVTVLRPHDPLTRKLVVIMAIGSAFQASDAIDFWFQAQFKARHAAWAKSSAFVITTAVRLALIAAGASLVAFAYAVLADSALAAGALYIAYKITGGSVKRWRPSAHRARALLSDSWPLMVSGLFVIVYMRIDQIMLGQLSTPKAVGIYSAAVRASESMYFIPTALAIAVYPSLLQARAHDESQYYTRLKNLFAAIVGFMYVLAVPATILSRQLMSFVFGANYAPGGTTLAVLVWAAPFVGLGVGRGLWASAEGFTRFTLGTTAAGAVVNVLLNFALIPRFDYLGSAIATVVSYAVAGVIGTSFYRPARRVFLLQLRALAIPVPRGLRRHAEAS